MITSLEFDAWSKSTLACPTYFPNQANPTHRDENFFEPEHALSYKRVEGALKPRYQNIMRTQFHFLPSRPPFELHLTPVLAHKVNIQRSSWYLSTDSDSCLILRKSRTSIARVAFYMAAAHAKRRK